MNSADKEHDSSSEGSDSGSEHTPKSKPKKKKVLTVKQIEDLKSAYAVFDIDGDSKVTADELKIVLEAIGVHTTLNNCHEMI